MQVLAYIATNLSIVQPPWYHAFASPTVTVKETQICVTLVPANFPEFLFLHCRIATICRVVKMASVSNDSPLVAHVKQLKELLSMEAISQEKFDREVKVLFQLHICACGSVRFGIV